MDVATSLVTSVVPHSYPVGAEEARQTAQRHAENPQVLAMQQSANMGSAADSRGTNALSNSLLYAQTEALISTSSEQIKKSDRKATETQKGRNTRVKEKADGGSSLKGTTSASGRASAQATSTSTASSAAFSGELSSAQKIMATSQYTGEVEHAKYSKEAADKQSEEQKIRTGVIVSRYNNSTALKPVGGHVNFLA